MSRVTIGELIEDVVPFTEEADKIITVEIVPRKILENLIKECKSQQDRCYSKMDGFVSADAPEWNYLFGKAMAYAEVIDEIKAQLRGFEEGTHDSNNQ